MVRSLAALSTLLGKPSCHTLVAGPRGTARISAYWSCGCTASGGGPMALELAACGAHRPQRVAAADAHVSAA
jgi:hypothetical protein